MHPSPQLRVAVDIGGTFTDVVARHGDTVTAMKVLTNYDDLPDSVLRGLSDVVARLDAEPAAIDTVFHATTIATNALLERRGARIGLITTEGFADTLELGRGRRSNPYTITPDRVLPLVPRELVEEVSERIDASGRVVVELDEEAVLRAGRRLRAAGVEAVAVVFLHSYLNPAHESRVRELLADELDLVLLSSEVLPEAREYERTSTSVVAAYLAPVVQRYLRDLKHRLGEIGAPESYWVMQSSGGLALDEAAARHPEQLVESGPAAGVVGTVNLLRGLGESRVISFDMGGTTAKAALIIDETPGINTEYEVGGASHAGDFLHKGTGMPLRVPVVDLDEVGTGGGSLAWIDDAGGLRVGPQSATSTPGPACYGLGGTRATVTDADAVLGYLAASGASGGIGALDVDAAFDAIRRDIAEPLGCDVHTAARGIVDLAVAQMADVVRSVSVAKGEDPRSCSLVAFGGAGSLHACAIAERLGIGRVYVPLLPGVHSALGLLVADFRVDLAHALRLVLTDDTGLEDAAGLAAELEERATRMLVEQGHPERDIETITTADMRYLGQTYEIRVPVTAWVDAAVLTKLFHEAHEAEFGYRSDEVEVEVTTVRVVGRVNSDASANLTAHVAAVTPSTRPVYFTSTPDETPVLGRESIGADGRRGPLIVTQPDTSVVVPPGATVRAVERGFLRIDFDETNPEHIGSEGEDRS